MYKEIKHPYRKEIGLIIRDFRQKKGLSEEELAEMMKMNSITIRKIEQGRFSISVDFLERFAELLDFELILKKK